VANQAVERIDLFVSIAGQRPNGMPVNLIEGRRKSSVNGFFRDPGRHSPAFSVDFQTRLY